MRRAPTRTTGLLALLAFSALLGCGDESRPLRPGTASLQIRLTFPDKSAADATGAAGVADAAAVAGAAGAAGSASPAAVEQIRVSAWELPADGGARIERGRDSTAIAPGDRRFRLELQVPSAALYLVQVEATGTLGSPANPTTGGLVFLGRQQIADVQAGDTRTIEIALARAVPVVTGLRVPAGLSLSWEPVLGALRYRLQETLLSPPQVQETVTLRTDTLVVLPPHAKPTEPEQRAYRVRAEFGDGLIGAYSESIAVSVPEPTAPAAIADLAVVLGTADALQLRWTATGNDERVGRASVYDLRRSLAPITTEAAFSAASVVSGVPLPQVSGQVETFTVTGLDPGTDYFFSIKAGDEAGLWSPLSNSARGTTLPLPPAAPRGLAAVALSATSIGLSWVDQAVNETRYRIERKSPSDADFVFADTLPGAFTDTVRYADRGRSERTRYAYRVRAENAGGASGWSNDATARTKPEPPRDLTAAAVAPDSVTLAWSYPFPDPADGFRLERRIDAAEFAEIAQPASTERGFVDTSVEPLGSYTYRLRAADAGDLSDPSDSVRVTMPDRPPLCRIDPATLDFDSVAVGSYAERAFTITNAGGGFLDGSIFTTCSEFTIAAGSGDFSLGANESRSVTVRFSPAVAGVAQCTLSPAGSCSPVVCTGVGEALPQCTVSAESLAFGTVPVGSTADRTVTVTNVGGGTLSGTVTTSCSAFSVVSGGTYALRAFQSQEVTIRFAPLAAGPDSCDATLTGGCASVVCTGTGEALPLCSVNPTTLDFGTVLVGLYEDRTFTIRNIGGGTLSGDVGVMDGCRYFSIVSGGGGFSLRGGESLVVTVRFRPGVAGSAACNVDLGVFGCSTVTCIGSGDATPSCLVNPTSVAFGIVPVGSSADTTFTVTNNGGGTLHGTISVACAYFSVFSGSGLSFSLGPGESHTATVRFTPADETPLTCTVMLGDNECDGIACSGAGELHAACTVAPTSLDFGTIEAGESTTRTFTVTNTGGGVLRGSITPPDSPDFSIESGEGDYALGPGEVHEVTVAFAPSTPGSHDGYIDASCKDGVTLIGVATDPNDHWWSGFVGYAPNGTVQTLALDGSNLAVGGMFTRVGGPTSQSVAWWNGSSWIARNDWTWEHVSALRTWEGPLGYGALAAAGLFSDIGIMVGLLTDGSWYGLGSPFTGGQVKVLANWEDNLWAGGSFTGPVPLLTYWNTDGWFEGNAGLVATSVNDLEEFNESLYAATSYNSLAGSIGALYRRSGSSWSLVTSTLSGTPLLTVVKLEVHAGSLYAAVQATSGWYVARLEGTTLVAVGKVEGAYNYIADLASDGQRLYITGDFSSVGTQSALRVASWDGSVWRALGSGIEGGQNQPACIFAYGGSIYVGGNFTLAGLKVSPNIARWIP